jgi:hypothetical protein
MANDNSGSWRIKVTADTSCGPMPSDGGANPSCVAPDEPTNLVLKPGQTAIDLSFASATTGTPAARFDVRYRENAPISASDFLSAIPPSTPPPTPGTPGSTVNMTISGLRPTQTYYVAVRALSMCDAASAIDSSPTTTTQQQFVTLHGCFIATAAYGSPLGEELDSLRHLRDRHLLTNPLGRLFVMTYYAMSPPFADVISRDERLRAGARAFVEPLVRIARAVERAESARR